MGTMAGTVMGTAGYMAPEQVNGEEVDRRVDALVQSVRPLGAVEVERGFVHPRARLLRGGVEAIDQHRLQPHIGRGGA